VRRATDADLGRVRALVDRVVAASAAADGAEPLDEAALLSLAHHGLSRSAVWTSDDGFALLRGHSLDVAVAPDARRRGQGRSLVEAVLETVPQERSPELTAWSHADHPAAAALARELGFERARELWVMSRDAGPVEVPPVEGVTIRGYRDTDAAEVVRVNAAAFAHHPEQGSMDAAGLAERMAQPWFEPAGLLVAEGRGTAEGLLAFHWTKQHSPELGEVYVVAVDPSAQGRGLGRAVTAAGLAHLAARGVRRIILYVESDNQAAIATYSKLGFTHTASQVQYARR
jgi:mycothiol synthase